MLHQGSHPQRSPETITTWLPGSHGVRPVAVAGTIPTQSPGSFSDKNITVLAPANLASGAASVQFNAPPFPPNPPQMAPVAQAVPSFPSIKKAKILLNHTSRYTHSVDHSEQVRSETRVVTVGPTSNFLEFKEQLLSSLGYEFTQRVSIKYELPGNEEVLVDLTMDDDVMNMWDELAEFVAVDKPTYKLRVQLQVLDLLTVSEGTARDGGRASQPPLPSPKPVPSALGISSVDATAQGRPSKQTMPVLRAAVAPAKTGCEDRRDGGNTAAEAVAQRLKGAITSKREVLRPSLQDVIPKMQLIPAEELRILRCLGGGSFGEVYLGKWLGGDVAIKCLKPELFSTMLWPGYTEDQVLAELVLEANSLVELRHPGIVQMYGVVLSNLEASQTSLPATKTLAMLIAKMSAATQPPIGTTPTTAAAPATALEAASTATVQWPPGTPLAQDALPAGPLPSPPASASTGEPAADTSTSRIPPAPQAFRDGCIANDSASPSAPRMHEEPVANDGAGGRCVSPSPGRSEEQAGLARAGPSGATAHAVAALDPRSQGGSVSASPGMTEEQVGLARAGPAGTTAHAAAALDPSSRGGPVSIARAAPTGTTMHAAAALDPPLFGGSGMSEEQIRLATATPDGLPVEHPISSKGPALVVEFLAGRSVRGSFMRNAGYMKDAVLKLQLVLDAAKGMEYLHSQGVVHGDLKWGNLIVGLRDHQPRCKVADYGLGRIKQLAMGSGLSGLKGTLPWLAPEVVRNLAAASFQADVYSFGVVMWALWTGREPFEGLAYADLLEVLANQTNVRPPLPGSPEWTGETHPEPAPGYSELLQLCWSEAPARRPSFTSIVKQLEAMMAAIRAAKSPTN